MSSGFYHFGLIHNFITFVQFVKTKHVSVCLQHIRSLTCAKRLFKEQPSSPDQVKTNAADVQLLSPDLHEQVFSPYTTGTTSHDLRKRELLSQEHLTIQDIWGNSSDHVAPIHVKLPGMYGDTIEEHFMRIGLEQTSTVLAQAEQLAHTDLPSIPQRGNDKLAGQDMTV
ncbi:unnamed protein product [Absidia cylindrospora]